MTWSPEFIQRCGDPDVGRKMATAIHSLLSEEGALLELDAHERTIAAHLACFMKRQFEGWNVDVEYNRLGDVTKRVTINADEKEVFPDIVVHQRRTTRNLLVVELKKGSESHADGVDVEKLRAYIRELHYEHGLALRLSTAPPVVSAYLWLPEEE